jgi:transcriptional regulator with XRE-family HTH domain
MNQLQNVIGLNIKVIRQARRLSLRDVAESCGIGISHLSQVERGVKGASDEVLRQIDAKLGLPSGFLASLPTRTSPDHADENWRALRRVTDDLASALDRLDRRLARLPEPAHA